MKFKKHLFNLVTLAILCSLFSFSKNAFKSESVATNATATELAGPGSYYDSIDDSLTGDSLKNALTTLNSSIRKSTVGYDGLRDKFQIIDRDWTGKEDNGKIVGFYNNALIGPSWDSGSTWNREHVWPNSRGGGSKGGSSTSPTVDQDAHMVRPTSTKINSSRGNDAYAEIGAYDPASEGITNYRGICARIIFYCAIADTNLTIEDSTSFSNVSMGKLSDLLKWNLQYKPDTSADAPLELRVEQNRNEAIQTQTVQKNRNPFIDHPEYACKIWGNTNSETKQICANSYEEIAPTNISLNKEELSLTVGESESLTVSVSPSNATASFTWSSSDNSVASVSSSGVISAISEGSAIITVTSNIDASIKASCSLTVIKSSLVTNSIKECYSKASGTSLNNVYGIYVGSGDGKNPIIMNGEYGILLYGYSIVSSWNKNETVLKVNGTLTIYNNLYEIKNCKVTEVTDEEEKAKNISPIVTYSITGSESPSNTELANRLCLVSGTITSATSSNKDYKATMELTNGKTVSLFVKSAYVSSLKSILLLNANLTLKGFTSIYSTSFQIQVFENVEIEESYKADDFASDLLAKTNTICASSINKGKELSPVWIDLEQNYYSKLSIEEKTTLLNSPSSYMSGTPIEQAMDRYDYIVITYNLNNFINRTISRSNIKVTDLEEKNNTILITFLGFFILISVSSTSIILSKKKAKKI